MNDQVSCEIGVNKIIVCLAFCMIKNMILICEASAYDTLVPGRYFQGSISQVLQSVLDREELREIQRRGGGDSTVIIYAIIV